MNILYDLITPQDIVGGAGEYIRKVLFTLQETIKETGSDAKIFGVYDSRKKIFAYSDLTPESIIKSGIIPVDIAGSSLNTLILNYSIDKLFIGCAQYWGSSYDITNIHIPCICVVHDLCDEDYADSHIPELIDYSLGLYEFIRRRLRCLILRILGHRKKPLLRMKGIMDMAKTNNNVQFVTVSEYTKTSFAYHFDYPTERIKILYSCLRVLPETNSINDNVLKDVISSGKKYYLFLSSNRDLKNPVHTFNAFKRFVECGNRDAYIVTTGCGEKKFENHIPLGYLSDADLVQAIKNCYALLFPTFMEGFGYPPIEAMGYGKPVLCSNVTSVPEICGDAAIYFSPLYESDIYKALKTLTPENYEIYKKKSEKRFKQVNDKQQSDLKELINLILGSCVYPRAH